MGREKAFEEALDAVDGPEEIDCCRTSPREAGADLFELRRKLAGGGGVAAQCAEGNSVGCGNTDGRSAADDHGDDDVGNLFVVSGEDVALLERELGLIDELYAFRGPGEGGNHAIPV